MIDRDTERKEAASGNPVTTRHLDRLVTLRGNLDRSHTAACLPSYPCTQLARPETLIKISEKKYQNIMSAGAGGWQIGEPVPPIDIPFFSKQTNKSKQIHRPQTTDS